MKSSTVLKRFIIPYTLFLFAFLANGCTETEVQGPVVPYIPERLNVVTENANASCTSDNNPFFSCYLDASLPFYQAETVKERVEVSFGAFDNKPAIINPAYRGLFNYLAMEDALFTNFMMTGISEADFDTIKTDYLFRDFTPADYYLNLTAHMNCIFFRSENSNYGLIRITSALGTGTAWSPVKVSFDMKYVNLAQ